MKEKPPLRGCRVDRHAAIDGAEINTALTQSVDQFDEALHPAAKPIELPYDQAIAAA